MTDKRGSTGWSFGEIDESTLPKGEAFTTQANLRVRPIGELDGEIEFLRILSHGNVLFPGAYTKVPGDDAEKPEKVTVLNSLGERKELPAGELVMPLLSDF